MPDKNPRIAYLDNAATTPLYPEVRQAVVQYLDSAHPANPTGAHLSGQKSRRKLDAAREQIADVCGIEPGGVIFCSGGTEADNLAVFGTLQTQAASAGGSVQPAAAVCSAIEHPAVLRPVQQTGGRITGVLTSGELDLNQLQDNLSEDTQLVSIMAVNNETGVIQPLQKIAEIVREKSPNALLHTDAVQAMLWLDISQAASGYDLISLSAHKFGGPAGVGVLLVRSPGAQKIFPQLLGGKQEQDRRSGTPNLAGAVGMAAAAVISAERRAELNKRAAKMRDRLLAGLIKEIPDICPTAAGAAKISGSCHICIPGITGEALLFLMTQKGVEASAASSCSSGAQEASYVLSAMGCSNDLAKGSLRLSLSHATDEKDINQALAVIPPAVAQLRR